MHLLDIDELTSQQITDIFKFAENMTNGTKKAWLEGKTFVLFFPESSLRTRITFENAIKELGGECILFPPETLDKREELRDVIKYIENWVHGIVVRHANFSKIKELGRHSTIPVINAMTSENHPCEILSDLYSVSKLRENYKELVYTFVGPVGNICRSWANIAAVMDLNFNHVCTSGHELGKDSRNYKFHTELDEILVSSDVVLTDSLPLEFRTDEYLNKYQITFDRMKLTKENSILNPCPPFFRGEEVSEDAISSEYFVGYAFKMNLLYIQQAVILHCLLH